MTPVGLARRSLGRAAPARDVADLAAVVAGGAHAFRKHVEVPTRAGRLTVRARGHFGMSSHIWGFFEADFDRGEGWIWLHRDQWRGLAVGDADASMTTMHELGHLVLDARLLAADELPPAVVRRTEDRADRFAIDAFEAMGWALPNPLRLQSSRWQRLAEARGALVEVVGRGPLAGRGVDVRV